MHRQLALVSLLFSSALALPPIRRGNSYPSVYVQNNIDINVEGASAPCPSATPQPPSYGGINVGVNVDTSVSAGDSSIDVDTHIEIDLNGNECEVNSQGVTVRTQINGVWYDANNLPSGYSSSPAPASGPAPAPPPAPALPPSPAPAGPPSSPPPSASLHARPFPAPLSAPVPPPSSPPAPGPPATPPSPPPPPPSPPPPSPPPSAPAPAPPPAPVPPPTSAPYFISGSGVKGISWDQFKGTDQACKTRGEIVADLQQLASYGYENVRIYGVECNAVDYAITALEGTGTNLIAGVYTVDNYTAETADFISQVNGRWDALTYVTVFNEAVNDGRATVEQVQEAIVYVKAQIDDSHVYVTTVDTFSAFIANPDLCDVGQDFIACNCEPYFGAVSASSAGEYVLQQQYNVAGVCNTDYVAITESGWPSAGDTLGDAVASAYNQYIAVTGIISALGRDVIVFEAFDDHWKAPGPDDVENYFGLYTSSSP